MNGDNLTVRVSAHHGASEVSLTVGELGVLLTAVNRSLNKIAIASPELVRQPLQLEYFPIREEPTVIQLRIASVGKGSVELQAVAEFLSAVGLDPDTARNILIGILANALYNYKQTQVIVADVARAISRVSHGALGKTMRIVIRVGQSGIRIDAAVAQDGKVRVSSERIPPDDVQ